MAFLTKVFGRKKLEDEVEVPPCPHTALVPRWDNNEDMGHIDKVSAYFCTACGNTFSPEEAEPFLG